MALLSLFLNVGFVILRINVPELIDIAPFMPMLALKDYQKPHTLHARKDDWLSRIRSPLSGLALYPAQWSFFRHKDSVIPWFDNNGTAIAWADPICDIEQNHIVLEAFTREMQDKKKSICLFAVDETTAHDALAIGYSVYKVAETPWFDLDKWHIPKGNRGKNLRWCLNHARKAGVTIVEYRPGVIRNIRYESAIKEIMGKWLATCRKQVVKSVMQPAPLQALNRKIIYIAMLGDLPLAFLACSPMPGVHGYYLEDIVRAPESVNGTGELLIVEALEHLKTRGVTCAALGPSPMRNRAQQLDPRAKWISPIISLAILFIKRFYPIEELSRYPEKFNPTRWEGTYLGFKPIIPGPRLIYHIIRTITG